MRIETDSYYVDRSGACHGPLRLRNDGFYSVGNTDMRWSSTGQFYPSTGGDFRDLTRPATPQEIATHHKTRLREAQPDNSAAEMTVADFWRVIENNGVLPENWSFQKRYEDECKVTKQQADMIAGRDKEIEKLRNSVQSLLSYNSAAPGQALRIQHITMVADLAARDKEIAKLREQVQLGNAHDTAARDKEIRVLKEHLENSRVWRAKRMAVIERQGEIIRNQREELSGVRRLLEEASHKLKDARDAALGTIEHQRQEIGKLHANIRTREERIAELCSTSNSAELRVRFENQRQTIADLQEEARRFRDNLDESNRALQGRIDQDAATIRRLQEFKLYVHKRLDDMGIESDPPGVHRDNGCRIGQRLALVAQQLAGGAPVGVHYHDERYVHARAEVQRLEIELGTERKIIAGLRGALQGIAEASAAIVTSTNKAHTA